MHAAAREFGAQVVRPALSLAECGCRPGPVEPAVLRNLEAGEQQALIEQNAAALEAGRSIEAHRLHHVQDQAQERSAILLTVLGGSHCVEQALPLGVLRVRGCLGCPERSDEVRDLRTGDGVSEDAAHLLDLRSGEYRW